MGRGGYTVLNTVNNITVSNDGQFGAAIITDVVSYCQISGSKLDQCQQALGTSQQPPYVFINLGVNDVNFSPPWVLPNQTTWQNNYLAVLDAINAQWPNALIYVTKPWKRQTGGDETLFDTMAGWVDNVVAARAFARVGDDERSWFKPNADTYSSDSGADRIHYNAAGSRAKVDALMAVLGF